MLPDPLKFKLDLDSVVSVTAGVVCEAGSVKRSCVRQSVCVCTIVRPRRTAGLLLSAVRAGDIDGGGRPPAAAPLLGAQQQQMRAVSRLQPT